MANLLFANNFAGISNPAVASTLAWGNGALPPSAAQHLNKRMLYVPPGQLGVNVIFEDGVAKITNIKPSCPLIGKIHVGDCITGINGLMLNSVNDLSIGMDRGRTIGVIGRPPSPDSHWKVRADKLLEQQPNLRYPLGGEYGRHPRTKELLAFIQGHVARGSVGLEIYEEFKASRRFIEYNREFQQWKVISDERRIKSSLADRANKCRQRLKRPREEKEQVSFVCISIPGLSFLFNAHCSLSHTN